MSRLSPFIVTRRNLYPFVPLRSAHASDLEALIVRLCHLHGVRESRRVALLAELYGLVERVSSRDAKRLLVGIQRDVHNNRPIRQLALVDDLHGRIDGVDEWIALDADIDELRREFSLLEERAIEDERGILRRWAKDPDVRRSVALTSTALLRTVIKYGETPRLDARLRKSETSLVTYFSKSTIKVSPFARFTGVHVGPIVSDANATSGGSVEFNTHVDVARLPYRRLFRRLLQLGINADVKWRPSDSVRLGDGVVQLWRRRWAATDSRSRVDVVSEELVRIPTTDGWTSAIRLLADVANAGVTLTELSEGVRRGLGVNAARAETYIERWIELGVLVPQQPAAEQDDDFLERWGEVLDSIPASAGGQAYRELHRQTLETLSAVRTGSGRERAAALDALRVGWDAVLSPVAASGSSSGHLASVVLEDTLLSQGVQVRPELLTDWQRSLESLFPLFAALDEQRLLEVAIEDVFLAEYGRDGVCTDLHALALLVSTSMASYFGTGGGERRSRASSPSGLMSELLTARSAAREAIRTAVFSDIDTADTSVFPLLPTSPPRGARSYAIFGQPASRGLIINHVYGGGGRFTSRFLRAVNPEIRDMVAAHVRGSATAGAVQYQMRSSLGFNANLSPLLAEREISLDDESTIRSDIRVRDLAMTWTEDGLQLHDVRTGENVEIVYLGFLVPHALPMVEMLLAGYRSNPQVSLEGFASALHAKLLAATSSVVSSPRVTARDIVLVRRRWAMRAADLIGMSGDDAFRRVNEWRLVHGIDDRVFVSALRAAAMNPLERVSAPKPLYVDFLSLLHIEHLAKRVAPLGEFLLLEELLPDPSLCADTHATELVFEIDELDPRRLKEDARDPGDTD